MQILASGCGFLRDQAFSIMFPFTEGSPAVASIYIAAFRPSDLLFQVLVMSCISVTLVPFLSAHQAHTRRNEMNDVLTSSIVILSAIFGCIAIVLFALFPSIAPYLVAYRGASLDLYVTMGRIALVTNFLFIAGNAFGQYLLAEESFLMYGLTPIVWAASTILGIYFLTPQIGVLGPIVGTLIGTILYVVLRFITAVRKGYRFALHRQSILHPELLAMSIMLLPRMAALGALQLQLLLLDRLASQFSDHAIAINQFASNVESVVPRIIGISIAQAVFARLSRHGARGENDELQGTLRRSIVMNLALSLPGAVCIGLAAPLIAWFMHIDPSAKSTFMNALILYCVSIPFESTNHVILRGFYARKHTTIPAVSSVLSSAFAVLSGYGFAAKLGMMTLPLAYGVGQVSQSTFLSIGHMLFEQRRTRG